MVGISGMDIKEEAKSTLNEIHKMISVYGEQGRLSHMDILLSFFTPYPHTKLYESTIENGASIQHSTYSSRFLED